METNLVAALVTLLAEKQKVAPPQDNTIAVVGLILAALVPTLAAIAAYISAKASKASTDDTRKLAVDTAAAVEKVHIAVNSGATAMAEKLQVATAEILRISKEMAGLKEQQWGQKIKDAEQAAVAMASVVRTAEARGPAFVPVPATVASTGGTVAATRETVAAAKETVAKAETAVSATEGQIKDIVREELKERRE